MSTDVPPQPSAKRRLFLAGTVALLVAAVAALVLLGGGGSSSRATGPGAAAATTDGERPTSGAPAPAPTTSGAETPPPVPTPPTGPTGDVDELPPSLPSVPLDEPAAVGDGISASVTSIEAIDGKGTGPGDVAGPALRVTIAVENGTAEPVSLDGVTVALSTGEELVPASPLADPSQFPLTGRVSPRGRSEGVYVFSVAEDARDRVTVSVGYRPGAPFMVFTGSAG